MTSLLTNELKDFVCLTSHCKCNSKCDDCSECENEIDKWLEEHDKQIRTDAIKECISLLEKYHIRGDLIKDLEQLKEQSNE